MRRSFAAEILRRAAPAQDDTKTALRDLTMTRRPRCAGSGDTAALYDPRVNIETRKKGDVIIVDFQGRLAIGVGDELLPTLIEQLLNEGNKKILLNLSDMDYIDSNGLGELVQSLKTSKRFGASLRLLKPQDRVRNTLRLTNLLPMFSVYESEADALRGFASES
ncbi:MAG TPA: anti-sigma factor antagonist [Thermoanaerobaculia bacterium]|nr:anti-sigma factor antagonist [Thermoanaerobaculia bacterium]